MQQNSKAISILQHHVDAAVSLIQSLKKKNQQLENQNQILTTELEKYKSNVNQALSKNKNYDDKIKDYQDKVQGYEDRMKTLETLLDEAQNEQALLEQSILTAINNLGSFDHPNNQQTTDTAPTTNTTKLFNNENKYDDDPTVSKLDNNDEQLEIF